MSVAAVVKHIYVHIHDSCSGTNELSIPYCEISCAFWHPQNLRGLQAREGMALSHLSRSLALRHGPLKRTKGTLRHKNFMAVSRASHGESQSMIVGHSRLAQKSSKI